MSTDTDRAYEVYQRQTEADLPVTIPPGFSVQPEFVDDPYPTLALLQQHYPCFRDWGTNSWWVTRYDDVTSLIADDASFEARPRRSLYGRAIGGTDLREEPRVRAAIGRIMQEDAERVAADALAEFANADHRDVVAGYVRSFSDGLLARILGVAAADVSRFGELVRAVHEGIGWHSGREDAGVRAAAALRQLCDEAISQKRTEPGDDVLSAVLVWQEGASDTELAEHVVATLVELDLETLEGSIANLLFLLLDDRDQLSLVLEDIELVRRGWQETMRHSPPVADSHRYSVREVERFGQLIPRGALVTCSAAAANRDPRIFDEPDRFWMERTDLAYREARGQFRTDGLASAVAPGLLPLSKLPVLPADRPPSFYALTERCATVAVQTLLDGVRGLRVGRSEVPALSARWPGDLRTCRRLIVERDGERG
jgi:pulcherriminic acid synthase